MSPGLDEHVLVRILHQVDEIDRALQAVALQGDEFLVAGIADAAGARDRVEHLVAGGIDRDLAGSVDLAEHGDLRRSLADDRHDRLRLDRAILQLFDDVLLNRRRPAVQHGDLPGVGNRDIALAVDRLIGQRDEIAGAAAGVGGNEQAARLRLEQGHLNGVADADLDLRHRLVPGAEGAKQRPGTGIVDQWQDAAVEIDERVIEQERSWVGPSVAAARASTSRRDGPLSEIAVQPADARAAASAARCIAALTSRPSLGGAFAFPRSRPRLRRPAARSRRRRCAAADEAGLWTEARHIGAPISTHRAETASRRLRRGFQVERHRPIVDVPEVPFDSSLHLRQLRRRATEIRDLRRAGQPGLDVMAQRVIADARFVFVIVATRADAGRQATSRRAVR